MAFESTGDVIPAGGIVGDECHVFRFEADFASDLRCIPMIVRLKLDRCGIKLSLRQWSRFTPVERTDLAKEPCDAPVDVAAFQDRLVQLVGQRGGGAIMELDIDANPPWACLDEVPLRIVQHANKLGIAAVSLAAWAGLSPLQRFALLKLTRDNHDNVNFLPAMAEFGLDVQPANENAAADDCSRISRIV